MEIKLSNTRSILVTGNKILHRVDILVCRTAHCLGSKSITQDIFLAVKFLDNDTQMRLIVVWGGKCDSHVG